MTKYLTINANGIITEAEAQETSAGSADADKIPVLNSDGHIDKSMIPNGTELINVNVAYALPIATKSKWELTLLSDTVLSFDMTDVPTVNSSSEITIVIKQDSTGSRTPTFQDGVVWSGGVPVWSTTPEATDIVEAFTVNNGITWYATLKGLSYVGLLAGVLFASATSDVIAAGSFVKKASDYESGSATVQASGNVVYAGAAAMAADAIAETSSTLISVGAVSMASNATINVDSGVVQAASVDMTSTSTIEPIGGINRNGAVNVTATATPDIDAEVYLYVEGVVDTTVSATTSVAGSRVFAGDVIIAAVATVAAVGTSVPAGPPLSIALTDSVNLGTDGAPNNGTFDDEGQVLTLSGGTAPYTFKITVNQWRTWGGSWTSGCAAQPFAIYINGSSMSKTGCVYGPSASAATLDLTTTYFDCNTPQDAYEFDCTIEVTDSLLNTDSDTFIGRSNLAF